MLTTLCAMYPRQCRTGLVAPALAMPSITLTINGPDVCWVVARLAYSSSRRKTMRDVLPDIEKWRSHGEQVALATVVSMAGSAPRRPGAKLAVSESGEISGSVSGGCVEPAVISAAEEVIKNGKPQML